MKAIYKNIALAALALGAAACSQEDEFSPSHLNDPDAVRITAQVGTDDVTGGFTRSNPIGTVEEQKVFNIGDQISVTAGTQEPVVYQLDTDGWKPVGDTYLKWQTNDLEIAAYYPVDRNNASATTFTVPTEYVNLAAFADADYMIYSGTQTKGDDKSIKLTMQRKMVRIVVDEISFNDQFIKDYSVTAIKVHSNTTGYADGEPVEGNIEVSALQQEGDFYALLAPTTEDENATFLTVTVTHKTDAEDTHTLTVKGIPATVAGNSYNYSLTVGKDIVGIGGVTVMDWTGSTIDGGEAEEVKVETIIEGTTATFNIPELANLAMIQRAVSEAIGQGATMLVFPGRVNESLQNGIVNGVATTSRLTLEFPEMDGGNLIENIKNNSANTVKYAYEIVDGTYEVYNAYGLQAWGTAARSNLNTNLTLKADINEGTINWTHIGTESAKYVGAIDGNGHTISGLRIGNGSRYMGLGFVGHLGNTGTIKDLIFSDVNVSGSTEAGTDHKWYGAFAGWSSGTITKCIVLSGTINAGRLTGGIVGENAGTVSMCANLADVSGRSSTGGLVGQNTGNVYASWTKYIDEETNGDDKYERNQNGVGYEYDGTLKGIKAFADVNSITEEDITTLNTANTIDTDYRWSWTSGEWPTLEKIEAAE